MIEKNYLNTIKDRSKKSHIYKKFQDTGLIIAELLNDHKHKALYIKLSKQYNEQFLMSIAKDVSERKNIENKGGYFMKVLQSKRSEVLSLSKDKLPPKPIKANKVLSLSKEVIKPKKSDGKSTS